MSTNNSVITSGSTIPATHRPFEGFELSTLGAGWVQLSRDLYYVVSPDGKQIQQMSERISVGQATDDWRIRSNLNPLYSSTKKAEKRREPRTCPSDFGEWEIKRDIGGISLIGRECSFLVSDTGIIAGCVNIEPASAEAVWDIAHERFDNRPRNNGQVRSYVNGKATETADQHTLDIPLIHSDGVFSWSYVPTKAQRLTMDQYGIMVEKELIAGIRETSDEMATAARTNKDRSKAASLLAASSGLQRFLDRNDDMRILKDVTKKAMTAALEAVSPKPMAACSAPYFKDTKQDGDGMYKCRVFTDGEFIVLETFGHTKKEAEDRADDAARAVLK